MRYFEDIQVGDALPTLTCAPVTHNQLVRYSGASDDFNPLHTDPETARQAELDGVIAHGMLVMGFLGRMIGAVAPPDRLRRFGVRFRGMTRIGDVITCQGTVIAREEVDGEGRICAEVQAVDQHGAIKANGSFEAALPRRP